MKKRFRFRDDERGATAVEFALVGPLFLLVIFGVMQVSIWVLAGVSLQHAAEMAARCAAVRSSACSCTASGCTDDGIKTYAASQVVALTVAKQAFTTSGVVGAKDACGGVLVTATFTPFNVGLGLPEFVANARACYPT